jgi:hypothetical protein
LPYEVEAVLMAKQFGVPPSQIEEEEDALLHIGLEGESVIKALAARDAWAADVGKGRQPTSDQWQTIMRVSDILKEEGIAERESDEDFSDVPVGGDPFAGINIED